MTNRVNEFDGWHDVVAEEWTEFIAHIDLISSRHDGQQHHFFYRGQQDSSWRLISSLLRELDGRNLKPERRAQIERDAKDEFVSQVHLHMPYSVLPQSDQDWLEWWALMQHYGATTR